MELLIRMLEEDTLYGGAEVFLAKEKKGAATLSTAYAVFRSSQPSLSLTERNTLISC